MNKTSYNNNSIFLPFLISNRTISDRKLINQKSDIIKQKTFSRNKKLNYNGRINNNKMKLYINLKSFREKKFPLYFRNNNNYLINNNNFDIKKLNKNFSSSLFNINNTSEKSNTLHFNKDNLNSSVENNINSNTINSTNKNALVLDMNKSDSLKNYNSSRLFASLLNKFSLDSRKNGSKSKVYKNTVYKVSEFFKKSKDEKIGAKQIYKHYLQQNSIRPKNHRHIFNGTYDYSYVMCPQLKVLYGDSPSFKNNLYEIKKNDYIAKKKDFKINEYQKLLMKLFEKKISDQNMDKLRNDFRVFNEKNYGMEIPKGRYINLALKLKDHLSDFAFENIKKLDRNYHKYYSNEKKEDNKDKRKNKNKKNKKENKISIKKIKVSKEKE